jgi:hypothetical protein
MRIPGHIGEQEVMAKDRQAARRRTREERGRRVRSLPLKPWFFSVSLLTIGVLAFIPAALADPGDPAGVPLHHYVFFGIDRERITERSFLDTQALEGAQIRYSWRQLEPREGGYDFRDIKHDLTFLRSQGKRLFIQIQDISYDMSIMPLPRYLLNNPAYHGGAEKQFSVQGDDDQHPIPDGWVARRWDPAVQERFQKLLLSLGREFDGKIEGINFAETSIDFGNTGRLYPRDFTPELYRDAVIANMRVLKQAFPRSVAMVYANFMVGGTQYLGDVYRQAKVLKVAMGGPDLKPYRYYQMINSYQLLHEIAGSVPTGIAVQDGNYEIPNPKTGKRVTVPELIEFARDYLKVDYVFWCQQEPFYSRDVIPYLKAHTGNR